MFENAKSIQRIVCPPTNAYEKYEKILIEVKKQNKFKLILVALGPTATVLAYDLSIIGYQTIDIGHIDIEYEWFLKSAVEKEPIKDKYIGEIAGGVDVGEINNWQYESEIIANVI